MGESHRLGPDVEFLQKPFSPIELARKVREVLDRVARSADAPRM
jgi:DNA-binding response OmpR family regulator